MEQNEIDLLELLNKAFRMVMGTWKILLPVLVAATVASTVYAKVTYKPLYESKTSFAVSKELNGEKNYQYNANAADELSTSFESLLYSDVMVDALCADIEEPVLPAQITCRRIGTTNLFTVYVRGDNPEDVSKVMQAFLDNYAKVFKASMMNINLDIVENPEKPEICNTPQYLKYIAYADGAIVVLYLVVIVLSGFLRRTVTEEEDIKNWLRSTCLGSLPYIKAFAGEGGVLITADGSRYSEMKDGIGSIRRRIEREKEKTGYKSFMLTSAYEGEGTTTVAANLALSLSYRGYKTALVDMNFHTPHLKKMFRFGEENEYHRTINIEDVVYIPCKAEADSNLHVYTLQNPTNHISDILNSKLFHKFIPVLAGQYDYIIIDAPAVLQRNDALAIGNMVNSSIFVIREDRTSVNDLIEAMERLSEMSSQVLGCVLNGSKTHVSRYGYGYGYGYGYKYGYGYGYGYRYGYGRGYGRKKKKVKEEKTDGGDK